MENNSLSDKIREFETTCDSEGEEYNLPDTILVKDVREAVKKLKEKLESKEFEDDEYPTNQSFLKGQITEIIKEIFGEKLI